jgi:Concanavalin A-like lectin/glucanases superfamily
MGGAVASHRRAARFAAGVLFAALILTAGLASSAAEDARAEQPPKVKLFHGKKVVPKHYRGDVRNLPQLAPGTLEEFERPDEPTGFGGGKTAPAAPAVEASPTQIPTPSISFKGLDFSNWGAGWPPDPVGDVGPNHFIEAVNTSIGIFSKTGTQLAAFTFDALWSTAGSGTACDADNGGDPTVIYDPMADRWIVADFAFTGNGSTGPYYECIAVSQTSDPVAGGWYLYPVRADDAAHPWFPDYPKMGIWPDGLYMTANMFSSTFQEVRGWAFNRTDLESGAPLRSVVADLNSSTYFSLLPSNTRGAPPPAGRPNFFVAESSTAYAFNVFKFHADYSGGGSTFTGPTAVTQSTYTVATSTVPSPANTLDSLRERLMMQAQYRNIGGTESLWVNHTVRTSPSGPDGIQWAQLNVTGGTFTTTPVQQQTYGNVGNDGLYRWMGSLAVDKDGYWLRVDNVAGAQRARFYIRDAGAYFGATSAVALTTGTTYHLVGTYDGTTLRIYVNGVDQGSATHPGAVDDSTFAFLISNSVSAWDGRLDEIAVYPTALATARVQLHYSQGQAG